jgi:hypothetical protein
VTAIVVRESTGDIAYRCGGVLYDDAGGTTISGGVIYAWNSRDVTPRRLRASWAEQNFYNRVVIVRYPADGSPATIVYREADVPAGANSGPSNLYVLWDGSRLFRGPWDRRLRPTRRSGTSGS